jgi:DNA-binding CsgD family transcriptional regulator
VAIPTDLGFSCIWLDSRLCEAHDAAMATGSRDLAALVADVERLATRALPYGELHREITDRLRRVMAIDASCWHGLDPANQLMTTADPVELLANGFLTADTEAIAAGAVLASEYQRHDVNSFTSLAKRRRPSAILSESTRGRPERSARYNEFLAPFGLPYEMRTVMVSRGRTWGCVIFHRTEASGDFTTADAELMGRLSRPIAEALRSSVRVDAARRAGPLAPGMVLLDGNDNVDLATPNTDELFGLLRHTDTVERGLPASVLIIAAQTRAAAKAGQQAPPLNVPTAAGWITLHGSMPDGERGRVAVILQGTPEDQAAPLRLHALALSDREREVATLVAQGLDTGTIAERLFISPWTVQDHCKAIFEKTDTRNRRELRAQIFFQDHLPAIAVRTPLDVGGHLDYT